MGDRDGEVEWGVMQTMNNKQVAEIFATIADMLEIKGENIHRVLSYRRAAENIDALGQDISELWREEILTEIPGVGTTIAAKIDELLRTGRLEFLERLSEEVPVGVVEMLRIPDVGPKTASRLWRELALTGIEDVERAARAGKIQALPRMGAKTEANILAGIEALRRRSGRAPLGVVWPLAQAMLDELAALENVTAASVAGSLRRMRDTIGDIDLLVAATPDHAEAIMIHFRQMSQVYEVLVGGGTKSSIRTHDGFQVDLRVLDPVRWGTALQYFTGSQAHNVRLRERARRQGLSLSENSFKLEDGGEILYADEAEVYECLGLPWIPPELREDRGEFDGPLPELITMEDMRGDLQMHSTWSDGANTVAELAEAALAQGLDYILITDHSQSLGIAGGLSVEELRRQRAEIDAVNEQLGDKIRVLAGVEVEVKADGSLDYPDEVLAELDLVLASLHTGLRTGREKTTERLLSAIRNPQVDIIAHPTGRLIGQREGADLDMAVIFQAAAETGTALEINADYRRLDLNDVHAHRAVELGVKLTIGSDAHNAEGVGGLDYGVATARRGWATATDVINAWPLERVLAWAKRDR
jgi:DNA polymerase (family 10)